MEQIKAFMLERLIHRSALTVCHTLSEHKHTAEARISSKELLTPNIVPSRQERAELHHMLSAFSQHTADSLITLILMDIKQCKNVTVKQSWCDHISRKPF